VLEAQVAGALPASHGDTAGALAEPVDRTRV
jgi:hypothetical protein